MKIVRLWHKDSVKLCHLKGGEVVQLERNDGKVDSNIYLVCKDGRDLLLCNVGIDVLRTDEHVYIIFKYPTSGLRLTRQQARDLAATLIEFANDITPPLSAA